MSILLLLLLAAVVAVLVFSYVYVQVNQLPDQGEPDEIDWDVLEHPEVWTLLPVLHNQRSAAEAYALHSGVSQEEAEKVIAFIVNNWDDLDHIREKKKRKNSPDD